MIPLSRIPEPVRFALVSHCQARVESMRTDRQSWWVHWSLLAEMFLPRRYKWFVSPNQWNRGSQQNQQIVDETGILAARTCATGMLAGLTSPTKPWFRLGIFGQDSIPEGPIKIWLADTTQRILDVLGGSNFYQSMGVKCHDEVVFGSAGVIIYEDSDTVVRFFNPALGEFFFAVSAKNEVDTLAREYTYTVSQCVEEFGIDNVSESTRQMYRTPSMKGNELVIGHIIEPNKELYQALEEVPNPVPSTFKYREVYWEQSTQSGQRSNGSILRVAGFRERPFAGFRWDVTSNDSYGRSPGMDALPAVRQLQLEQRRKAEGIDKMVRPPMVGSVSMRNEPMDILPGGVTFVADPAAAGFKPAFTVEPRIAELMEDLKEVQARVKETFFNNLFMAITQLDTVRTATDIDARQGEQLIQLGPVIERDESELDSIIHRVYAIMARRKMFLPTPPELSGATLSTEYISMLAEAQRSYTTTAIERWVQFGAGIVAVVPDAMDNYKTDEIIEYYGDKLTVPPNLVRAMKDVLAIRAQRTQQQQQAAALQSGQTLAQGAQTLSQTQVGGGKSALDLMLGQAA